jgi:hypothetical protein
MWLIISIIFSVILLTLWIAYSYYYWPQWEMKRYKALFEELGYTACIRPFKFLGLGVITDLKEAEKTHKDALYYEKFKYGKFDVDISNALNKVLINLINPELIKEFLSA